VEQPRVVILCGGRGTRMGSETDIVPKPMLRIDGERPILWHIMSHFSAYGFKRFVLLLGYKSNIIRDYFFNLPRYKRDCVLELTSKSIECEFLSPSTTSGWEITLLETGLDTQTGARLAQAHDILRDELFLLTYGDGVSNVDLGALLEFHKSHGRTATVTAVSPPSRFGELKCDGDVVSAFEEKPQHVNEHRINGGYFVFNPTVFDFLSRIPTCRLEGMPLRRMTERGELAAFNHDGFWQCMDTVRDLEYLSNLWRSGEAPWAVSEKRIEVK
jgi:glucose-1-phosphate cytidylyltransferase